METVKGLVERVTYHNPENGFSVLKIKMPGQRDQATLVGMLGTVNVGAVIKAKGAWKHDGRYGRRFEVSEFQETVPATLHGLQRYLGSGLIKGIGPVNARRIVQHFRENTLDILENQPERLQEISGIGSKRAMMIREAWNEQKEVKNVMLFLQSHGVSTAYGVKIFKIYRETSIQKVSDNPYRLAEDVWGIGFKTADKIAFNLGFTHEHPERIASGIVHVLNELSGEGHCFATRGQLLAAASSILEVDERLLETGLDKLVREKKIVGTETGQFYLPVFYHSEEGVARGIVRIVSTESPFAGVEEAAILKHLPRKITYDMIQLQALKAAVAAKCMVLTGGPGTGKTTITLAIINVFESLGAKVQLCAPTGRAAKRLSETTRRDAKTIHRLLEYKPGEGFHKNSEHPLACGVLIVDEASMLDIVLMNHLVKALKPDCVLILVGDVDQLPSVGPGNVLRDIIQSGIVKVVTLNRIYRQAKGSMIVTNAHRINQGLFPRLTGTRQRDFFHVDADDPDRIPEMIIELCQKRLPAFYRIDPVRDIQVLCPMQRGSTGTLNLNQLLQASLNPQTKNIQHGQAVYRLHDKVMQIRNNYDKNVFNGDIGRISGIDEINRVVYVNFDGQTVEYQAGEMDELVLAYAMTVHKSQGSEYPVVIAPLTTQHFMMLQRNLLYTCVTRARKAFVLVGSKKAIAMAVKNKRVTERNTRLNERLRIYREEHKPAALME